MKKFVTILLALVLTLSAVLPVSAAQGKVTFQSGVGSFDFAPGSDPSPTDLFPDFKDVMPGDTLTQRITVKNDSRQYSYVRIYLRALGAHEGSEEFLSQLELKVKQVGGNTLFEAPAHETAQLSNWVHLGNLLPKGEVELEVTLTVPVTLDSKYQNEIGYLDWEFKADAINVKPGDGDDSGEGGGGSIYPGTDDGTGGGGTGTGTESADTGDTFSMGAWAAVAVCACGGVVAVLSRRKRENS